MHRQAREFRVDIEGNGRFISNCGEPFRRGEQISTGFEDSTINQVIGKRMANKQLMQRTPRGAHVRLQVRTKVLNGDWEEQFRAANAGPGPVEIAPDVRPVAA